MQKSPKQIFEAGIEVLSSFAMGERAFSRNSFRAGAAEKIDRCREQAGRRLLWAEVYQNKLNFNKLSRLDFLRSRRIKAKKG